MSKRTRLDRRVILIDDMKTANDIKDYCMRNFMNKLDRTIYGSVYVFKDIIDTKVRVIFRCTVDEWQRVAAHYDLMKSKEHSRNTYELKSI